MVCWVYVMVCWVYVLVCVDMVVSRERWGKHVSVAGCGWWVNWWGNGEVVEVVVGAGWQQSTR